MTVWRNYGFELDICFRKNSMHRCFFFVVYACTRGRCFVAVMQMALTMSMVRIRTPVLLMDGMFLGLGDLFIMEG